MWLYKYVSSRWGTPNTYFYRGYITRSFIYLYKGVLIIRPTRKETNHNDQTRDLFNILPTKLNTVPVLLL